VVYAARVHTSDPSLPLVYAQESISLTPATGLLIKSPYFRPPRLPSLPAAMGCFPSKLFTKQDPTQGEGPQEQEPGAPGAPGAEAVTVPGAEGVTGVVTGAEAVTVSGAGAGTGAEAVTGVSGSGGMGGVGR